jgi:hypothetical protein
MLRRPAPPFVVALAAVLASAWATARLAAADPAATPPGGQASQPSAGQQAVQPPAAQPPDARREPRADGTVSVVVAADRADPRPPGSAATELVNRVLEPLATAGANPADRPPAPTAPPPVSALYARPLSLVEALERSGERSRRLWISQAYWRVSAGFAMLRWSIEALERLELVAPGGDPHDRAVLDVALAAARADLAD